MLTYINNYHNISDAIQKKLFPTITMWNRLEGRPRTHHFDKALKAEVRDALWMLCKQWQMGEFKGEDAGSPVFSKIMIKHSHLTNYSLGDENDFQNLNKNLPLETLIEQKQISFERNNQNISLDIRLELGIYWHKLLKSISIEKDYFPDYLEKYKFECPIEGRTSDFIHAHKEELQQWMAISGRCIDGYELIKCIKKGFPASTGITFNEPTHENILDELGKKLIEFYDRIIVQSDNEKKDAWLPDKLEYKAEFVAESGTEKNTLKAEEYYQGHLDWYAFNLESSNVRGTGEEILDKDTFIPTHVEFEGMPNRRWWKFEDYKTSFGDVTPATTDLSKLLLIEFGLTYANDWFLLPFTLPIGSISEIQGLTVTNNFGDNFWVEATEKGGSRLSDWSVFRQTSETLNKKLFLCPSAIKVQEGNPIEEVWLIRDEMANMVWGIEKVVPSSMGKGVQGGEYAMQKRQYHEKIVELINQTKIEALYYLNHLKGLDALSLELDEAKHDIEGIISELEMKYPEIFNLIVRFNSIKKVLDVNHQLIEFIEPKNISDYKANISYLAMSGVPENWIPFIPVHADGQRRQIQLQRGSMLRIIDGDTLTPEKIKPLSNILREGLESKPKPQPYYIHEEEITRAGTRVIQGFQRTRWLDGRVFVWFGAKKKTGRGEGNSGLVFDKLENVKTK